MKNRLNRKNAVYTPGSRTTRMINYDDAHRLLEIEFKTGEVYHYLNVPYSVWKEYVSVITDGKSSGIFFNTRIKDFYACVHILE